MSNRTKFNVDKNISKRTFDGIIFDSVLEMKYYKEVLCPLAKSGVVVNYELQKPYELQPKFTHNEKTVHSIKYIADFFIVYKDGREEVIDIKGYADSVAILKRKLFLYHYPDIDYKWITWKEKYGGWIEYDECKKIKRNEKNKRLKNNE